MTRPIYVKLRLDFNSHIRMFILWFQSISLPFSSSFPYLAWHSLDIKLFIIPHNWDHDVVNYQHSSLPPFLTTPPPLVTLKVRDMTHAVFTAKTLSSPRASGDVLPIHHRPLWFTVLPHTNYAWLPRPPLRAATSESQIKNSTFDCNLPGLWEFGPCCCFTVSREYPSGKMSRENN